MIRKLSEMLMGLLLLAPLAGCGNDESNPEPVIDPVEEGRDNPDDSENTETLCDYYYDKQGEKQTLNRLENHYFIGATLKDQDAVKEQLGAEGIEIVRVLKTGYKNNSYFPNYMFVEIKPDNRVLDYKDLCNLLNDENVYVGPVYKQPSVNQFYTEENDSIFASDREFSIIIDGGGYLAYRSILAERNIVYRGGTDKELNLYAPRNMCGVEMSNILFEEGTSKGTSRLSLYCDEINPMFPCSN